MCPCQLRSWKLRLPCFTCPHSRQYWTSSEQTQFPPHGVFLLTFLPILASFTWILPAVWKKWAEWRYQNCWNVPRAQKDRKRLLKWSCFGDIWYTIAQLKDLMWSCVERLTFWLQFFPKWLSGTFCEFGSVCTCVKKTEPTPPAYWHSPFCPFSHSYVSCSAPERPKQLALNSHFSPAKAPQSRSPPYH